MSARGMPPHILTLFQPRTPLDILPAFKKRRTRPYEGISCLIDEFETKTPDPPPPFETPKERRVRIKREKLRKHLEKQKELIQMYSPHKDPKLTGDPFRTLFIGNVSYDTTEKKLKREFEVYGPIKKVRCTRSEDGKPRGYAFIEFERDEDMKEAYKKADGTKIDGRRVLVDVERARTVPGWLPRRLGGGRGPPRGMGGKAQADVAALLANHAASSAPPKEREDRDRNNYAHRDRRDGDRDRRDGDRDRRDGDRDRRDGDRRGGDRERRDGDRERRDGDRDRRERRDRRDGDRRERGRSRSRERVDRRR